jgi:hypothetical protein
MRTFLIVSALFFAVAESARAQETPAQVVQVSPAGPELPNAPTPKVEPDAPPPFDPNATEENSPCPAGVGKPCAMLGGQAYYLDLWHMTEHDRTWLDAMKHPPILIMSLLLIGTTVADIEGTDYCLRLHGCREVNPVMPKNGNRAWQYPLAMSFNGLAIYFAGRLKQRGQGNRAFFELAVLSAAHSYFALDAHAVPPISGAANSNFRHQ